MNPSRIIATIVFLIAAIASASVTPAQSVDTHTTAQRDRAVALWEEAIRAKGGRERLQSVESLLISSTVDTEAQRGSSRTETERLYGMPGKAWIYTLTPELDVSLDVTVINNERNLCTVTLGPSGSDIPTLSHCLPTAMLQFLIQEPVIYLMETKWVRPVPVGSRTEGKGNRLIDVVETKVGKLRVDFYLDRKTRLPTKLVTEWYGGLTQATGPLGLMTVELRDYVSIDGILMPRSVIREPEVGANSGGGISRRDRERARYRFNVVHNPAIFDRAASRRVKAEDWKSPK